MDFENFGDYIYLILLVIFSIAGALSKKKKKNVLPSEPTEDMFESYQESQDVMESIQDKSVQPESEPAMQATTTQYQSIHSQLKENLRFASSIQKDKIAAKEADTKKEHGFGSVIKLNEIKSGKSGVKIQLSDIEELRKGVIYAELIKPKYFTW